MSILTKALLAIVIIVALCFASRQLGYRAGKNEIFAKWDAQKIADAKAIQEKQQAYNKANAAADTQYQKGLQDGQTNLNDALNRLAIADKRLRKHQYSTGRMPATSGTTSKCDGAQRGRFLDASGAASLLRLANEADDNTKQLTACQSILEGLQ